MILNNFNKYLEKRFGIIINSSNQVYVKEFISHNQAFFLEKNPNFSSLNLQELVNKLTINETYFFRDENQINFFKNHINERIKTKTSKNLTIWSMGCSGGEEPYTLAILLEEIGILNAPGWNIDIYGFDINNEILEKARNGIYYNWSFRNTNPNYIKKYFIQTSKNHYKINNTIKNKVKFNLFNLKEDLFNSKKNKLYGVPDIIFCRNILMYFRKDDIDMIVNKLAELMNKDGCLVPGIQEVRLFDSPKLSSKFIDNTYIYVSNKPSKTSAPLVKNAKENGKIALHSQPLLKQNLQAAGVIGFEKIKADHLLDQISHSITNEDYKDLLKNIMSQLNNKEYEPALLLCEEAINYRPHDFIPYYIRSSIFEHMQETEKAMVDIKKALFLNSDCALIHYSYSNLFIKQKRLDKAEHHLKKADKLLENNNDSALILEILNLGKKELQDFIKRTLEMIK